MHNISDIGRWNLDYLGAGGIAIHLVLIKGDQQASDTDVERAK